VANPSHLTHLQQQILDALIAHPEGLDIFQLRELVGSTGPQEHFNRRLRGIYAHYIIERVRDGKRFIYKYVGPRPEGSLDDVAISNTLRAKILHIYGERCQMCGRTVVEDHVKLHIDHKIPREWGGKTVEENLWPLCTECNQGKKNYFATFDPELMTKVLHEDSVHLRIALLLKEKIGEWVDSDLLRFVANFKTYQEDWQKRLRELRYTGLEIEHRNRKVGRRVKSYYRITNWVELPADVTAFAREYERNRAAKNRAKIKEA
jgi:HNH endonuclease